MKVIIVFSGGGAMGNISLSAFSSIEKCLGKPLFEIADLVIGSSIGAITAGILSTGKMSPESLLKMYKDVMCKTFKRNVFRFYPRYKRDAIDIAIDKYIGNDFLMKDCLTRLIVTAVKAEDKSNHYFKSWQPIDGAMTLKEAVTRSYAAPLYFGRLVRSDGVWLDGGSGSMNTPIITGIWEALRRGWLGNERVHILSLGTGYTSEESTHDRLQKMRWLKEISLFIDPADGGLARYQSMRDNVKAATSLIGHVDGFSFQHADMPIQRRLNRIDGAKFINNYVHIGKIIARYIDYKPLREKCM